MKILSIAALSAALLLTASLAVAQGQETIDRTYPTSYGTIDFEKLERKISSELSGHQVKIMKMRRSYNPFQLKSEYKIFPIEFTIDGTHDVSCDLILRVKDDRSYVTDCESRTAKVYIGGMFPFAAVKSPQLQ
jgi:hypothetical protein